MIVTSQQLARALHDGRTLLCRPCAVEKYGMGVALVEAGHSAAPGNLTLAKSGRCMRCGDSA